MNNDFESEGLILTKRKTMSKENVENFVEESKKALLRATLFHNAIVEIDLLMRSIEKPECIFRSSGFCLQKYDLKDDQIWAIMDFITGRGFDVTYFHDEKCLELKFTNEPGCIFQNIYHPSINLIRNS